MTTTTFQDIDAYIASFPPAVQAMLTQVRETIHKAVPEAGEKISYGIPTFTLHGNLIHFGAYKSHIGVYGHTGASIDAYKDQLAPYLNEKGSIALPLDEPLPLSLLTNVVQFSARERTEKAALKRSNRSGGKK
jgi:uncharacterized protein YdhG (YjbR/CyaY superfamily)